MTCFLAFYRCDFGKENKFFELRPQNTHKNRTFAQADDISKNMSAKKILGIGNALVDAIVKLPSDDLLNMLQLSKGGMQLVDDNQSQKVLASIEHLVPQFTAGGSAANAISGISYLGVETGFIGMVGNDGKGDMFINAMSKQGTEPLFFRSENTATGIAATLVSQDGERTFATYLGAATEMKAEKLTTELFRRYDIFHIEGFLMDNRNLIRKAVALAKENKCMVSIDLGSYNTVSENHAFLQELLPDIDIVFANEEEAYAYAHTKDPLKALDVFANTCSYSIVKVGKRGAYLKHNNEVYMFPAHSVSCVDTTGAGDLFAAGFLAGLAQDKNVEDCGFMATLLAENIIGVMGAKMSDAQWKHILSKIK